MQAQQNKNTLNNNRFDQQDQTDNSQIQFHQRHHSTKDNLDIHLKRGEENFNIEKSLM